MKATVILVGLLALALLSLLGDAATAATGLAPKTSEPSWILLSGATLIALGSAVRRYIP
jgi:hypothetical protein